MELTTAKDSPVVAVLAGHVHFYDKDYIDGEKDVLQIVGDAGFHNSAVSLTIKGAESCIRTSLQSLPSSIIRLIDSI